ncbi:glycerophosphodiester phosphodiesterase [Brevibacillus laterosporus]|uniref:Glycerophosphodiester phosphodiesterase n=1 Tax=Brevibacillus laterosporus TaxID=1465 RepID=A0A502IR94_BRELA|nr:glycerophosphodiester phosphodiesterase family protein [Brevibacillus laterosporus]QDX93893.1 glycerophosphodiester phosphodiesterase [Brevibacillus laterosporus]RAP27735.1 Glycerophosphoryl diester phosphodiesterase [Brevibacillus laterosporus]TPG67839.1 glycerophosphodiester phosphodiesterase [Brevibacillus laterosporus]TPG89467.1 glycerophosphodiester phosphodiesterase [Brevibacillus laterosporus]
MQSNVCIAHRGWSGVAPENTLAAIRLAIEHPEIDGVEFDVQLTKDQIPVVIHDYSLERTTNGTGWVKDHTFAELRSLDAGSWFDSQFVGETIPSLEEVLIANRQKKWLNIELKQMVASKEQVLEEKVIRLIEQYDMEEHVVITSFQHQSVYNVKRLAPRLQVGPLIYGMPLLLQEQAQHIGADVLSLAYPYLTHEVAQHAQEWGYSIIAWTVDEPEHMRVLAQLGSHVHICTNHPDRWLSWKGSTA